MGLKKKKFTLDQLHVQKPLIHEDNLQSYFFEKLEKLNGQCSQQLPTEVLLYSSSVLNQFVSSENFFDVEEGKVREKILGVKLLESSSLGKEERKRVLKDVGDTSLFMCGFFSESINKKIIDLSYYQQLGKNAYGQLNPLLPDYFDFPNFYQMISEAFEDVTFMISSVSKDSFSSDNN